MITVNAARRRAAVHAGVAALLVLLAGGVTAQTTSVPSEGIAARPSRHVLLVNARIVPEPGRTIEDGSIELRDGRIVAIHGARASVPGAATRDLGGKTVFAGFIEPFASIGVPEEMRAGAIKPFPTPGQGPHQTTLDQAGARHWNRRVRPEWSVAERLDYTPEAAKTLRSLGFASAYAVPGAGVVKGQGALLSLRDTVQDKDVVLAADRSQHFGFELAGGFSGEYPGSLMGAIALIRQSLLDARAHADPVSTNRVEANLALDALVPAALGKQRAFFQLDDELDVQRVDRIVREFDLDAVLVGAGYEYRVIDQVRNAAVPFILPLAFPEPPKVELAEVALNTSLAELQHWEQAPANPGRVAAAGVRFALTSHGLKEADKHFWAAMRRAVRAGLDEDDALRALTVTPAMLVGESARLGRIAPGQLANLVVADAGLFRDEKAKLYETWVEGERFEHHRIAAVVATGEWRLDWGQGRGPASISLAGEGDVLEARVGDRAFKAKLSGEQLLMLAPEALFGGATDAGSSRLSAIVRGDTLEGYRDLADGRRQRFTGVRAAPAKPVEGKEASTPPPSTIPATGTYPAGEFARAGMPGQDTVLFRNATVWTNAEDGILASADVLVRNGRIAAVGTALEAPSNAILVDARGKHLTPGIIDAHSHTAIARNVNEPSHAVTTEVRIADALDPTDIDIYRQLAGGVTTANLLHGSANPMGGQNAVIKLRWGADAQGLLLAGAAPGVKFALGENVKQSGWGDGFVTRYPQTRMGVEQVMREHFNAAREYAARRAGKDGGRMRRDLRLEALAEILEGKRLVHVHSYRQDEILMFARLARDYGLPVATFQHVLEGYKVADAIADIGAGASTFSDWWGYKMEVLDGIPHAGALMTRAGVVTSFNSDSNEMARRLNMEAAKAMRHGGLDEQEALKLVTLNPAIQLRLSDRIGAIRAGMDADLALWSEHPLSNYARVEQTWIEGRKYFDREQDRALQAQGTGERERLIRKALDERSKELKLVAGGAKETGRTEAEADADAVDPALAQAIAHDRHWTTRHATARGLYHSGADLTSCGINDHVH
jgi:imidazolonepropionase-like amidohydrolase